MYTENLKSIRKELGLSVAKLADRLEMSASTLTGYERGERTPSINLFTQLCLKLGINLNWFISGKGTMFIDQCENTHVLLKNDLPDINYKSWGKRLGQILADNKETPYAFSKRTGIKESRIEKFILDSVDPTMAEINAIKRNVDVSLDELFYGQTTEKNSTQSENQLSAEEIAKLRKLIN